MRERVRRRILPLIASVGLIVIGMYTTTLGPTLIGRTEWALPYDLWGTLIATTRLAHGNIGGLYAPPTGLISLPGAGRYSSGSGSRALSTASCASRSGLLVTCPLSLRTSFRSI